MGSEAQSSLSLQAMLRQRTLLALCALAAVAIAVALWMTLNLYGASGARWVPSGAPFVDEVAAVQDGSPAEGAGLRVGDRLDIRDLSPENRLRDRHQRLRLRHHGEGLRLHVPHRARSAAAEG